MSVNFLSSNVVHSADRLTRAVGWRWEERRDSCLIAWGPCINWTSICWHHCSSCCGRCTLWAESHFLLDLLFSHFFHFISFVTSIPYLLSFYNAECDSLRDMHDFLLELRRVGCIVHKQATNWRHNTPYWVKYAYTRLGSRTVQTRCVKIISSIKGFSAVIEGVQGAVYIYPSDQVIINNLNSVLNFANRSVMVTNTRLCLIMSAERRMGKWRYSSVDTYLGH